jgi:hypothetical protein
MYQGRLAGGQLVKGKGSINHRGEVGGRRGAREAN